MDFKTVSYYSANAKDVANRYESVQSPLAGYFSTVFSPGAKILDIGCGSGRDMAELTRQGCSAYGIDATPEFVQLAQELHPELAGRVTQAVLPDFEVPFGGNFDGVLCSAVLMHIDASELLSAALSIKRCLKVGGRLLISIPSQRSDLTETERDSRGRLFKSYAPGYIRLVFERLGFGLVDQWESKDALERQGMNWVTLVFQLRSAGNSRPIDQIDGVLNQDKKSSTYKFALLRALAEIATQSPQKVEWITNDTVALPVRDVADRWLKYYWPLIESRVFIPQMSGEEDSSAKKIKFRNRLSELIELYKSCGGYSGFQIQRNKGLISSTTKRLWEGVMSDISYAIVNGPVKFSGGSLATGQVFHYDSKKKQILIPVDFWLELSHLGYWIGQAVVLQWADKSSRLGSDVDIADVTRLLLDQEDDRNTVEARQIFSRISGLECVWTGKSLRDGFHVDHVIPFDLWRNNDAWNLLPASKKANSKKSNKLPSTQLLRSRRDCIIGYWEILRERDESRFDREAETLLHLPSDNWQTALYGQMCHAIEVTALQRGVGRWPSP